MVKKTITDQYRLHVARQLKESILETSNSAYYFFLGVHSPRDIPEVPDITLDLKSLQFDPYREMIMGKRISANDLSMVVRNIPYVSNTIYAMYDDTDRDLASKDYYVVVNNGGGSFYHVFKCLDNNSNTASTVEPDFAHIIGSNTTIYQTSDGYRWKYMYSTDTSKYRKFASSKFINVLANTEVSAQAISGAIDIIKVENGGRGYDNFYSGTFASADLKVNANPQLYRLGSTASLEDDFYVGCLLYISTGNGVGGYRRITGYDGDNQLITIETPFPSSELPTEGSQYQIYPEVQIIGSGVQLTNAVARAIVNGNAGNSISRVEMLERGRNYDIATANVIANSVVLVDRSAVLRPIQSPVNGHGFDAETELGATHLCIGMTFVGSDTNLLLDNEIQQFGILHDPLFNNVFLMAEDVFGVFKTDELVYKVTPVRLNTNVTMVELSDTIQCNTAEFDNQVASGDWLYFVSSNGSSFQLTQVDTVVDNTNLILTDLGLITDNAAVMYFANVSSSGYVSNVTEDGIYISNVAGIFSVEDKVIGRDTGTLIIPDTIKRSNTEKNFDSYIQLYKYTVNVSSGTFDENEILYKGTSNNQTANGLIHSTINIDYGEFDIYVSNQLGTFSLGDTVRGLESSAVGIIEEIQYPELRFGSGEIIYLENIDPITRGNSQSESYKIYLEF